MCIPSNWEEKAGLSSRWETELEPVPEKKRMSIRVLVSGSTLNPYLTGRAERAAPKRPGARWQEEPASPGVRSTKT